MVSNVEFRDRSHGKKAVCSLLLDHWDLAHIELFNDHLPSTEGFQVNQNIHISIFVYSPRLRNSLLRELTDLEDFESIKPEECLQTKPFVNGGDGWSALFVFIGLIFRINCNNLYKANIF